MKLTLALLLASLSFLVPGIEGLYRAFTSRQPAALTCDQLEGAPAVRTSWLKVSGCQLGYDVGYRDRGGEMAELVFPVRKPGQAWPQPALMLAATRDPEVLAIAQSALPGGREPDEEARTVMMLRIVTALGAAQEIRGYVRGGLLELSGARKTMSATDASFVPGAQVLDLNQTPPVVLPAVLTAIGTLLLIMAVARLLLRQEAKAPEAVEAPVADEPAAPSGSQGVRITGLMLLNLGPSAGRDAIEKAPPLGAREDVEQSIARAMPGMTFDPQGRGTLASETGSITIDLGPDPVAWTAVLHGHGRGIHRAVRALVADTGWRMYYPKRGTFLDIDDLELL